MSNPQTQACTPDYPAFVRKLFNRSGDPSKDLSHAILGLVTEAREYAKATDLVNAVEELGDAEFYMVAMQQVIEDFLGETLPMADIELQVEDDVRVFLSQSATHQDDMLHDVKNDLLDHAKRWVGYERAPVSLAAVYAEARFVQVASREIGIAPHSAYTQSHIRAVNMAKLLKRYPGGDFDQFRALQRDLGGERETLEAAVLG